MNYITTIRNGKKYYLCKCGYEATALSELATHDLRRHE